MSRQREAVPRVVRRVAACGVDAGLIIGGSVRYGYERPDSDLDFFAIGVPGLEQALSEFSLISEKHGSKLLESREGAFPIHIAYWSPDSMDHVLSTIPYMTYPLLDGEVVDDPVGLARRYRDRIRSYFNARPKLTEAWERQLDEVRRLKTGQVRDLAFGRWSDFIRHIEDTRLDEIAERRPGADAEDSAAQR